MENILRTLEVIISVLGAVAFTISSAMLGAVIRYSNKHGLTNNVKEMKIAMVAFGFFALYLWAIFFELTR